MIEEIVIGYLSSKMEVPVLAERAEEPTSSYILIAKTGSSEVNHITTSTLIFQSFSASLYEAAKLNELLKANIKYMMELPQIINCKLNTDYNNSDKEKKEYMYQAVYQITHY